MTGFHRTVLCCYYFEDLFFESGPEDVELNQPKLVVNFGGCFSNYTPHVMVVARQRLFEHVVDFSHYKKKIFNVQLP